MLLHNSTDTGDWLPVTSSADMLSGSEAAAQLIRYRLNLFKKDWWENPEAGNPVLELFRTERITAESLSRIVNAVTEYIEQTQDVVSVEDIQGWIEEREIHYSCRVITAYGETQISAEF